MDIKFKYKNRRGKIVVVTGEILPPPQTQGRQIIFQIEGDAVSYRWILTFTTTWLAKHDYGRSAEGKEDDLGLRAVKVVRKWLSSGLSGNREIVVQNNASEGVLRI